MILCVNPECGHHKINENFIFSCFFFWETADAEPGFMLTVQDFMVTFLWCGLSIDCVTSLSNVQGPSHLLAHVKLQY